MTSSEKNGLTIRTNASPKLDRTSCHLLASRIGCKCPMETFHKKVMTPKNSNKVHFDNNITI